MTMRKITLHLDDGYCRLLEARAATAGLTLDQFVKAAIADPAQLVTRLGQAAAPRPTAKCINLDAFRVRK